MQIGRLRNYVTIEQQSVTQNSYNEEIVTWGALAQVWAEIKPIVAYERLVKAADQVVATVTHRVRIRYRTDVTPKMRIKHGSRCFDIEGVQGDPTGKQAELYLLCKEVQ